MFKAFKLRKSLFFQAFFVSIKCAPFILKIEKDFKKTKKLELMNLFFITHLNKFGSKVFLILKIMSFENVTLTKVVDIYAIEGMNT